ncbi:MAG: glycosyltransferase family 1 protein [Bacteroidota bacterium]
MDNQERIKVAIDLTPLRPGGENGGAKTLITTLLKEFTHCRADEFQYLLIAESWNYEELKDYEADNIICMLKHDLFSYTRESKPTNIPQRQGVSSPEKTQKLRLKLLFRKVFNSSKYILNRFLSKVPRLKEKIKTKVLSVKVKARAIAKPSPKVLTGILPKSGILQERYGIDLLFCPFSAPIFAESGLPIVAIAYDLQHLELPFFFKGHERLHRTTFLRDLLAKANKVVCISEFTRQSFLNHFQASPQQLTAIPICIHERLRQREIEDTRYVLKQLGLKNNSYLFFPANFWPHKNHRLLLAAYSIYRQKNPHSPLDLVFTGALEEPQTALKEFVRSLGYENNIHFLGFLDESQLVAVWQGARGLIFPSLYEGFGIPVLEAMWFDKPVACSFTGSLPEVGGDAVIYFDPRKPEDVAEAMTQLGHNTNFVISFQKKARERLKLFKKEAMTHQYLNVFSEALVTK